MTRAERRARNAETNAAIARYLEEHDPYDLAGRRLGCAAVMFFALMVVAIVFVVWVVASWWIG